MGGVSVRLHHAFFRFPCYRVLSTSYLLLHTYHYFTNKPNCVGIIAISDGSLLMQEGSSPKKGASRNIAKSTEPGPRDHRVGYNYKRMMSADTLGLERRNARDAKMNYQPLLISVNEEHLMNAFAYNRFDTDTAYRNVSKASRTGG